MKKLNELHLVCVWAKEYFDNNVENNNDNNNNNEDNLSERTGCVAFGLVWVATAHMLPRRIPTYAKDSFKLNQIQLNSIQSNGNCTRDALSTSSLGFLLIVMDSKLFYALILAFLMFDLLHVYLIF